MIFGALALSALTVLALAMLLPQLILVLGTDLFTNKVVDARHYLMLVHLLSFAMMAWLAGAHACVSRHKAAIAVLASIQVTAVGPSIAAAGLDWVIVASDRCRDVTLASRHDG